MAKLILNVYGKIVEFDFDPLEAFQKCGFEDGSAPGSEAIVSAVQNTLESRMPPEYTLNFVYTTGHNDYLYITPTDKPVTEDNYRNDIPPEEFFSKYPELKKLLDELIVEY